MNVVLNVPASGTSCETGGPPRYRAELGGEDDSDDDPDSPKSAAKTAPVIADRAGTLQRAGSYAPVRAGQD